MHPRVRKLVGTVVLFAFLVVYVLLAMAVYIVLERYQIGWFGALVYHALAGLAWVPPAAVIVSWMQRTPQPRAH
jgi:hypothetical protein